MIRNLVALAVCLLSSLAISGPIPPGTFDFEASTPGEQPVGWMGGPVGTLGVDGEVAYAGERSGRIRREPGSDGEFSSLTLRLPAEVEGATITLRGWLRVEAVAEYAGFWLRLDGPSGPVGFAHTYDEKLSGTRDWSFFECELPLDPNARSVFCGVVLAGVGTVWADNLELLVDGASFDEAPPRAVPETVLDTDQEFASGSGIGGIKDVTEVQVQNLATLCRVWGFLKYHHPAVTGGKHHWDFELFRRLPAVLAAEDRETARAAMLAWQDVLGPADGDPGPTAEPQEYHLEPDLAWFRDERNLGPDLMVWLDDVRLGRWRESKQFYIRPVPNVGNADFIHEPPYPVVPKSDTGYRLLALFRYWNIIQWWFPYRDQIEADWGGVLEEFIPRVMAAEGDDYDRTFLALAARVGDGHANFWSALLKRPPIGGKGVPVVIRFIEGEPTVVAFKEGSGVLDTGLRIGDVVTAMDGRPVGELMDEWRPYYASSNERHRRRHMAGQFTNGERDTVIVTVRRGGETLTVAAPRMPMDRSDLMGTKDHYLTGDTFQLLSPGVAYLKLASVKIADARSYVERAVGTQGLVIDIRNYPSEFMVFALGQRLVTETTPIARFTRPDLANPGAFAWTEPTVLTPQPPHYGGKVVILVDESSMSQAEYTAMAFRASPGAVVVGSTTAGADGNVSPFALPGGLTTMISGIGIFYPDQTPTQRIGIVPDHFIEPTLEGIVAGRDEVLEKAVELILGRAPEPGEVALPGR